jgi:pimeloyl-ACP methyl ester carboxylesterase
MTDDLKKFDVPTLFIHGDDDQTVPIEVTARPASKLVKNAKLKVYRAAATACRPQIGTSSMPTSSPSSRNEV